MVIPGAIILSASTDANLKYDAQAREISFLRKTPAFLVIDGQHRLYGAHLANFDVPLVVSIRACPRSALTCSRSRRSV